MNIILNCFCITDLGSLIGYFDCGNFQIGCRVLITPLFGSTACKLHFSKCISHCSMLRGRELVSQPYFKFGLACSKYLGQFVPTFETPI